MAGHLCNMPDEVIHTILTKLDDDMRAVLRLSQASHRFASLASRPERGARCCSTTGDRRLWQSSGTQQAVL
jgi:hypothetical protein